MVKHKHLKFKGSNYLNMPPSSVELYQPWPICVPNL